MAFGTIIRSFAMPASHSTSSFAKFAVDGRHIYLGDYKNNRVQVLDYNGVVIRDVSASGSIAAWWGKAGMRGLWTRTGDAPNLRDTAGVILAAGAPTALYVLDPAAQYGNRILGTRNTASPATQSFSQATCLGVVIRTVELGVAFVGCATDGRNLYIAFSDSTLVKYDMRAGVVIATGTSPSASGELDCDGRILWFASDDTDTFYQLAVA